MLIQLLEELHEKQKQEAKMQEELDSLKDSLRFEKQNLGEVTSDRDKLISLSNEKDSALQVRMISGVKLFKISSHFFIMILVMVYQAAMLEKRSMEARLAKLGNLALDNNSKKDLIGTNNQVKLGENNCYPINFNVYIVILSEFKCSNFCLLLNIMAPFFFQQI